MIIRQAKLFVALASLIYCSIDCTATAFSDDRILDNDGNVVVKYAYDAWGVRGDQTYKEFKKGVAKKPHQSGKDLIFKKIYLVKK